MIVCKSNFKMFCTKAVAFLLMFTAVEVWATPLFYFYSQTEPNGEAQLIGCADLFMQSMVDVMPGVERHFFDGVPDVDGLPGMAGCEFQGWYVDPKTPASNPFSFYKDRPMYGGDDLPPSFWDSGDFWDFFTNDTARTDFYAKWNVVEKREIIFNANDDWCSTHALPANVYPLATGQMPNVECVVGQDVQLPKNEFNKDGFVFKGWATAAAFPVTYLDGATVRASDFPPGSNFLLYAVWEAKTVVITLDYREWSGTSQNIKTKTATTGYGIQMPWFPIVTSPSDVIDGWYTAPSGGTRVDTGTWWVPTKDTTYYLHWRHKTCTIKFNANGGTGSMPNQPFTMGINQRLSVNQFQHDGYVFSGWAKSSGGAVVYTDGEGVLQPTVIDGGTVTLYAVWTNEGTEEKPLLPDWTPVVQPDTVIGYYVVKNAKTDDFVEADGSVLGVFAANGECRGVAQVARGPGGLLFQLTIGVANPSESGFSFKVWDAATGEIHNVNEKISSFVGVETFGSILAPMTLTFGDHGFDPVDASDFEIVDGVLKKYNGAGGAVTVPEGVTSIEYGVFGNKYGFSSVMLPSSLKSIARGAFNNCPDLTSIHVADGNAYFSSVDGVLFNKDKSELVVFPGGYAGEYLIPPGVTSIGELAFAYCLGLTGVAIPSSVKRIGFCAFYDCRGLVSAKMSEGLEVIGDSSFDGCYNLKTVTIPSSVVSIEGSAFSSCTGLESVMMLPGVTSIGSYAFYSCRGLESVTIPSSVTSIGSRAFAECGEMSEIVVEDGNATYCSRDGILYDRGISELIQCPAGKKGIVSIPPSVTSIGHGAFEYCSGLELVMIPSSVASIETFAFSGCSGLTEIVVAGDNEAYCSLDGILYNKAMSELIQCPAGKRGEANVPASVTDIWTYAFSGCSGLTAIVVAEDNAVYSSFDGILYNKEMSELIRCPEGKSGALVMPEGVTSIGEVSFANCAVLASVTMPVGVTSVGAGAFIGCDELVAVMLPPSVSRIEDSAFYNCWSLMMVYVDTGDETRIRDLMTKSGFNCSNLTFQNYDSGYAVIYKSGLYGFGPLQAVTKTRGHELTLKDAIFARTGYVQAGWSLRSDGSTRDYGLGAAYVVDAPIVFYPFWEQTNYTLVIDDGKLTGGTGSLPGNMVIPSEVRAIGDGCFALASNLTSVVIPESVTNIGPYAFFGCSNLETVVFHEGLVSIDSGAFAQCVSLGEIALPSSVRRVGDALASTNAVAAVVQRNDESAQDSTNFVETVSGRQVSRYQEMSEELHEMTLWNRGWGAFDGCSALASVTLNEGLEMLGAATFRDCISLTELEVPESVVRIGGQMEWVEQDGAQSPSHAMASQQIDGEAPVVTSVDTASQRDVVSLSHRDVGFLEGCVNLERVVLPLELECLGPRAFANCRALREIDLPEHLSALDRGTFFGCTQLRKVGLPSDLEIIGRGELPYLWQWEYASSLQRLNGGPASVRTVETISAITNGVASSAQSVNGGRWSIVTAENSDMRYRPEDGVFYGCAALRELELPATVRTLCDYSFADCGDLQLTFVGPPPTCGTNAVADCQVGFYLPELADQWVQVIVDGLWNGLEMRELSDVPSPATSHSIDMVLPGAGWHEVSFAVLPTSGNPADVFAPVEDKVGYVTYGSLNWNPLTGGTLMALEIGKGYWVQTTAANVSWTVTGGANPGVEIALKPGWNLIGYPLLEEGEVETVLATALATGKIDWIYSGSRVYPGTLTTMAPGKGYWVYANAAVTIKFNVP